MLLIACASDPDSKPATERLEPRGARVAGAIIGPDGGTILVPADQGDYAGTTVDVATGVFDQDTRIELVQLRHTTDAEEEMPVVLAVLAERAFGAGQITVTVPRGNPILGAAPEGQTLYGYARGTYDWIEFDTTGDSPETTPLQGTLSAHVAAAEAAEKAGHAVVGETTESAAAAVTAKRRGVALGFGDLGFEDGGRDVATHLARGSALLVVKASLPLKTLWLNVAQLRTTAEDGDLAGLICASGGQRVIVTHGVLSHTDSFAGEDDVLVGLRGLGWQVGRFDYPTGYPIAGNGARFGTLLQAIRAACDDASAQGPDALGHSMGGLVLRSAVQDNGAVLRRVVMLSTPNGGGKLTELIPDTSLDADAEGALATLQRTAPGLSVDLLGGSAFLNALNAPESVTAHTDGYYLVAGWSSETGPLANDGSVSLSSAVLLALPADHEHYFALNESGAPTAFAVPDDLPAPLDGSPDDRFGHSAIHEQAGSNGVLAHIAERLSGD